MHAKPCTGNREHLSWSPLTPLRATRPCSRPSRKRSTSGARFQIVRLGSQTAREWVKASSAQMSSLHHSHRAQEFPKTWRLEQPVGGSAREHSLIELLQNSQGNLSAKNANATLSRPERGSNLGAGTQVKPFVSVDLLHAELDKTPQLVFFCWPLSESTDRRGEGWGKSVSQCGQLDTTSFERPCCQLEGSH